MTTILVGTDTTAAADLAVENAADLARARDAELLVLYVRPESDLRAVADPRRRHDPNGYLAAMRDRFPDVRTRTRTEAGDPAETICEVAAQESADTIVIGNRGAQGGRWAVRDAVPTMVLRHAPCSVFIVDTRKAQ